jgi:dCMP deaminase
MTHDAIYLREACKVGAHESQDHQTQNGALLRSKRGLVVTAANVLPPMVVPTEERMARPNKYKFIEHAERAVIYAAAKAGIPTDGAVLYCPWFACADCARAIILAGITRVVGHTKPRIQSPERWVESILAADQMFHEAGVEIELLQAELGVRYLFNGGWLEL